MKPRRGELIKLGALFEKYTRTLRAPQKTVEKAACEVISSITNLSIAVEQIKYTVSTQTLYISAPALIKSELKMRQGEILQTLKERLGAEGSPKQLL